MRSSRQVGRVAAVGAAIAAIAIVALVLFGPGADGYTVKARFLNAGQLVKGNPVQVGGVPIGSVAGIRITDSGQAEVELSIDDDHAPLRRGTRGDPPVLAVGARQPLHRPQAAAALGGRDRRRRRDRGRQHGHPGRPGRAPQHARRRDAALAAGLFQGIGGSVQGQDTRGGHRVRIPQPDALHRRPAGERADQGHAAARALPGGQLAARYRRGRAPRRPRRRCPGAAEAPVPDGSNVFSAEEQAQLGCTEAHRAVPK
jgi:MlaD protein